MINAKFASFESPLIPGAGKNKTIAQTVKKITLQTGAISVNCIAFYINFL